MAKSAVLGWFEKLDPFLVFSFLARSDLRSSLKKVPLLIDLIRRYLTTCFSMEIQRSSPSLFPLSLSLAVFMTVGRFSSMSISENFNLHHLQFKNASRLTKESISLDSRGSVLANNLLFILFQTSEHPSNLVIWSRNDQKPLHSVLLNGAINFYCLEKSFSIGD